MTANSLYGLTAETARQRLAQDDPDELPVSQPHNLLHLVREVGLEPMFLLLLACGSVYMALSDTHEALLLLAFVLVALSIRLDQQRRTERSLAALRDIEPAGAGHGRWPGSLDCRP